MVERLHQCNRGRHVAQLAWPLEDETVSGTEPARSSAMSRTQKLWHVSKTHLLELFEECFWRRAVVQPATLAAL